MNAFGKQSDPKWQILSKHQQRNFIIWVSIQNFFVSFAYTALNIQNSIPVWPNILWGLNSLFVLFLLRFTKSLFISSHMLILVNGSYLVFLVAIFNDFPYSIVLWMPVIGMQCVYLVGWIAGALWSLVIGSGCVLMLVYGKEIVAPISLDMSQIIAATAATMLLTTACGIGLSFLFQRSIDLLLTELRNNNNQLRERQKEIEQLVREKESLVNVVCHDIVTPLSIIMYYAGQAAQNHPFPGVDKICRSAETMNDIVDCVRSFQAIKSGKKEVNLSKVSLLDLVTNSQYLFEDRLKDKEMTMTIECERGCNPYVMAEKVSLSNSVINNLISNAIKFSPKGESIVLKVEDKDGVASLSVKDRGIGIPPSLAEKLFKPDANTSRRGTAGEPGTGFGLPLTKAFMDLFGGRIVVKSKTKEQAAPGEHGTTFVLEFDSIR